MRRLPLFALIVLLGIRNCNAQAPKPPAPAPAVAAAPKVDDLLDDLDQRGQNLKSFDADVKLIERDESTSLETTRAGRVWYQKVKDGNERIRVLFDKILEGKISRESKIEYLLEAGWLSDRDYTKRIEVRRQVLRPGEKTNLLKLGEGPFPLPIGQKKEDVKKLFDVSLIKPDKDDPEGAPTRHLLLKPIAGTQFARKFSALDVWVDPQTHMPRRIATLDRKEVTTRSTDLSNVRINPPLADGDFKLAKIPLENWNTHEEPFAD